MKWTPPANENGAPVTSYIIEKKDQYRLDFNYYLKNSPKAFVFLHSIIDVTLQQLILNYFVVRLINLLVDNIMYITWQK